MEVHAVGDELEVGTVVVEQSGDRTGLAVVDRAHRVEQVSAGGSTGGKSSPGGGVGGVGVTDRGDGAVADDPADSVQSTVELGGEGHHANAPAGCVEEVLDLRGSRRPKLGRIVGACVMRAEPGSLQVQADQDPVVDEW